METLAMLQEDSLKADMKDNAQEGKYGDKYADWLGHSAFGGGHLGGSEFDRVAYERSRSLSRDLSRQIQGALQPQSLHQGPLPLPGSEALLSHGFSQGLLQQGELTHPSLRDHHRQLQMLQGSLPLPGGLEDGLSHGTLLGLRGALADRHTYRHAEQRTEGPIMPQPPSNMLSEVKRAKSQSTEISHSSTLTASSHGEARRDGPSQEREMGTDKSDRQTDKSDGVSRNVSSDASIATSCAESGRGVSRHATSDTWMGSWRNDESDRGGDLYTDAGYHGPSRNNSPTQDAAKSSASDEHSGSGAAPSSPHSSDAANSSSENGSSGNRSHATRKAGETSASDTPTGGAMTRHASGGAPEAKRRRTAAAAGSLPT